MKPIVLRAQLRKWQDRDLVAIVKGLNLEQGEMSDLVRTGFLLALQQREINLSERMGSH